jgi:hypothetical protein
MSFAERWVRYLEEKGMIIDLFLIGDVPKDTLYTKIYTEDGKIYQQLEHWDGMRIPDEIKITPIAVREVEVRTGRYNFHIEKEENGEVSMEIRYVSATEDLTHKEEKEMINKAKKLGYRVKALEITDV